MSKLFTGLCFALLAFTALAAPRSEKPYLPVGHHAAPFRYPQRTDVAHEAVIAILGDSLSAEYPPRHEWTEFIGDYSPEWRGAFVSNFAVSGQCAWEAVNIYESTVHTIRPSSANENAWLFVWLGINDLGTNQRAEDIYFNLQRLWSAARYDGFRVAAFTITRGGAFTPENGLYQEWEKLNNMILSDPTLYDALCRPDLLFPSPTDPSYFMDGIHPTPLGAQKIAAWIAGEMKDHW